MRGWGGGKKDVKGRERRARWTYHFPTDQHSLPGLINVLLYQNPVPRSVGLGEQLLDLHAHQLVPLVGKELACHLVGNKYPRCPRVNRHDCLVWIPSHAGEDVRGLPHRRERWGEGLCHEGHVERGVEALGKRSDKGACQVGVGRAPQAAPTASAQRWVVAEVEKGVSGEVVQRETAALQFASLLPLPPPGAGGGSLLLRGGPRVHILHCSTWREEGAQEGKVWACTYTCTVLQLFSYLLATSNLSFKIVYVCEYHQDLHVLYGEKLSVGLSFRILSRHPKF